MDNDEPDTEGVEAIVDVAIQTGENTAAIEEQKETTEELEEKQEQLEQEQRWTSDSLSRLWNEMWEKDDRFRALEERVAKLEQVETKEGHEELKDTPGGQEVKTEEGTGTETVIDTNSKPKEEKKKSSWWNPLW
jgi:predicted nuclease with TOPRIM domain